MGTTQLVGQLTALIFVLVVFPLRGDFSFWTGLLTVGATVLLLGLAYFPEHFRGQELFLAIFAGLITALVAPQHIKHLGFYAATAQIVPVLFIALAVESRAFRPHPGMDSVDRRGAVFTAAFLVVAGYYSLRALAAGDADAANFNLVAAALVAATVAIALPAIAGHKT